MFAPSGALRGPFLSTCGRPPKGSPSDSGPVVFGVNSGRFVWALLVNEGVDLCRNMQRWVVLVFMFLSKRNTTPGPRRRRSMFNKCPGSPGSAQIWPAPADSGRSWPLGPMLADILQKSTHIGRFWTEAVHCRLTAARPWQSSTKHGRFGRVCSRARSALDRIGRCWCCSVGLLANLSKVSRNIGPQDGIWQFWAELALLREVLSNLWTTSSPGSPAEQCSGIHAAQPLPCVSATPLQVDSQAQVRSKRPEEVNTTPN